jgi:hypothetical protein
MEIVQKAMEDRRKRNSGDGDDCQSAIQCIQAGKELSARRLRLFYRTHAAQKHCGVQECVEPTQSLQFVVSHHSGQKRYRNEHRPQGDAAHQAPEESKTRKQRLRAIFEHGERSQGGYNPATRRLKQIQLRKYTAPCWRSLTRDGEQHFTPLDRGGTAAREFEDVRERSQLG